MNSRVSAVDGHNYAIGFEIRMPNAWNGRFFYQANGGIDGSVVTATGPVNGGPGLTSALSMGFAVISSDAGHVGSQGPFFGIDPQARLDYGYQAAATLTPMAKAAIKTAYGKGPDRSYFGGCSNGGRHTMVAAAREPDQYDGYLVGDPGFRLPLAAIANIAAAQGYATVATNPADISTGFTATEQKLVASAVLAKCDALDGATDGLVQDTKACQAAFSLDRDVPTCTGARDGTCLSAAQKTVIAKRFSGETTSTGTVFYSSWPFDAGIGYGNTAFWNFTSPVVLDSGAVGIIWETPPEDPTTFNGPVFALAGSVDTMLAKVAATNATYTESAMSFMIPPTPSNLPALKNRGAKMMVFHGTSDPIFSSDDTTAWYEALRANNGGDASNFARLYRIPGMTHCSDGRATDQFDMLTPLVAWVEQGVAPDSVIATARGPGNAAAVNADIPSSWAPNRSRPLCAYPKVARYSGSGSLDDAANFSCQ
jgi:pimeloyl-ACP methyl ester carboxylesterase